MTTEVVAQGIEKIVVIAKQTNGKGDTTNAGGTTIRRVTHVPTADRDTFTNNEIASHQQDTGISYGLKKTASKLSGLLSPGTYSALFAAVLRKDFAAGVTTGAVAVIASAAGTGGYSAQGFVVFHRSAGNFLTTGFKVGDIVRPSGFATTGAVNNNKNALIVALTATDMTCWFFNGQAAGVKAEGDNVTIAVVGKKTLAPLTGHTNDYFIVEDWYSDIERSEAFLDMKPNQLDIGSPATGNVTFGCDFIGLSRQRDDEQLLAAPAAETTTEVVTALNGIIWYNGVALAEVTGASLTITGNLAQGDAVMGSNSPVDIARGRVSVKGQFTALFSALTVPLQDLYDNETPLSLVLTLMVNKSDGTSGFVSFSMGKVKLTGDAPDDGEKMIVRTYPFVAQINGSGGTNLAWDKTILTVQDSDAA